MGETSSGVLTNTQVQCSESYNDSGDNPNLGPLLETVSHYLLTKLSVKMIKMSENVCSSMRLIVTFSPSP